MTRRRPLAELVSGAGPVKSVIFSPDGSKVVSATLNGAVEVWDIATGRLVGDPLDVGPGRVVLGPDGKTAATIKGTLTSSGSVQLWDLAMRSTMGTPITGFRGPIESVAFSRDVRRLASVGFDQSVRLWDVPSGAPVGQPMIGHTSTPLKVAFSPDGTTVASVSLDHVFLWDVGTQKLIDTIPKPGRSINPLWSIGFSEDSARLAVGYVDGSVAVFDVAKQEAVVEAMRGHSEVVADVAFSVDGKSLASASQDKSVALWSLEGGVPMASQLAGHIDSISSVGFSPDGSLLASGSSDTTVRLWDVATRQPVGEPLTVSGIPRAEDFVNRGIKLTS